MLQQAVLVSPKPSELGQFQADPGVECGEAVSNAMLFPGIVRIAQRNALKC